MSDPIEDEFYSVLLLYPDTKAAALGSPGFRQVFRTLDDCDDIVVDWGWYDGKNDKVVYECRDWKRAYDIVGFSVPYELLYANAVRCLIDLDIEPEREKRCEKAPVVMAGGAAPIINPVVAGSIADVVYAGEAEQNLPETIREILRKGKTGAAKKLTPMSGRRLPEKLMAAPRFISANENIDSSFLGKYDDPSLSAFRNAGLVEVGRGCSRGCRFCAAGHVYLPVRHRSVDDILRDAASYRGRAERIGLVGASISDYRYLKDVMRGILDMGFGLTTSSFRADMLDGELAILLKKGGLKTVTIAPEGGSPRMRSIVNKRLTEEDILRATESCRNAGIENLRLYYMVGLPWERESDIEAICGLTDTVRRTFSRPGGKITVSVNPFIPKPNTPFQWCGMADSGTIKKTYRVLERSFRRMPGVTLKTLGVRSALREAVISLGDRAVGNAIVANARDAVPWKKALTDYGIDSANLIHREKDADESFPWDRFTGEKTKTALRASFESAHRAAIENKS